MPFCGANVTHEYTSSPTRVTDRHTLVAGGPRHGGACGTVCAHRAGVGGHGCDGHGDDGMAGAGVLGRRTTGRAVLYFLRVLRDRRARRGHAHLVSALGCPPLSHGPAHLSPRCVGIGNFGASLHGYNLARPGHTCAPGARPRSGFCWPVLRPFHGPRFPPRAMVRCAGRVPGGPYPAACDTGRHGFWDRHQRARRLRAHVRPFRLPTVGLDRRWRRHCDRHDLHVPGVAELRADRPASAPLSAAGPLLARGLVTNLRNCPAWHSHSRGSLGRDRHVFRSQPCSWV